MYDIDNYLLNDNFEDVNYLEEWQEKPLIKIEKLLNYVSVLEGQNANIDNELERMNNLKKTNKNKIDNIKKFILLIMGDKPLNIGTHRISKRNSQAVEILDENKVPEEFKEQKITYSISKTKIKEFLSKNIINQETGEITQPVCDFAILKNNINLLIK